MKVFSVPTTYSIYNQVRPAHPSQVNYDKLKYHLSLASLNLASPVGRWGYKK